MALSKVGGNQIDTVSDGLTVDDDGATVLTVDRATDNGAVIDIQKDGTSVGSVQSRGSAVTSVIFDPRSNGAGMTGTTNAIMPTNQSGAIGDGTAVVDLGASGYRYRNLFLSGNLYLGGTGSSNALNDYEEGTWTGTLKGQTSDPSTAVTATGYYTKIGRLVRVSIDFDNVNTTGAAGRVEVHGVPITQGTGAGGAANGIAALYNFNIHSCNGISVQHYNGVLFVYCSRDQNTWVNATHLAGTSRYLQITATYHT